MPTYLPTRDALNVDVSCFANYDTPANPKPVKLITWLTNTKHRTKVDTIRSIDDKVKRDEIKATLPAITPSGTFPYRKADLLIEHSGWLQFDIDKKDNPHIRNYADLKAQLRKLPFIGYCGLSVSGTGYWGLVPIAHPDRHGQHFDALKRVFAHYGVQLDEKPRSVSSLRGYSYDAEGYLADTVMIFDLYDEPQPITTRSFTYTSNADEERERVEACIGEISRRGIDITSGYNYWYSIGCDLASTFGESGRDYFHVISQAHPEYNIAQCDKQFAHCLRSYKEVQLKTFFGRCRDVGVSWKDLLPHSHNTQPERTQPIDIRNKSIGGLPGKTGKSSATLDKLPPSTVIIPDEVLIVEFSDSYPADWDTPTLRSSPSMRASFPTTPLSYSASDQLRRIQSCVTPLYEGRDEFKHSLVPSLNRDHFAQILNVGAEQLPLYEIKPS
jgi:hypothetical protein